MQIPKEIASPINKALYRLSMGDMTTGEMILYLTDPRRKNTGFPLEIAQRTVDFLVAEGMLDDKRYLRLAVRKLDESAVGPRKIREVLTRKKFPAAYVEAALNRSVDYTARAERLLRKKTGAFELAKTMPGKKKLTDYLVRRGYDYSTAIAAVNSISEGEELFEEPSFLD